MSHVDQCGVLPEQAAIFRTAAVVTLSIYNIVTAQRQAVSGGDCESVFRNSEQRFAAARAVLVVSCIETKWCDADQPQYCCPDAHDNDTDHTACVA